MTGERVVNIKRIGKRTLALLAAEYAKDVEELGGIPSRPRTYGDCIRQGLGVVHRCPWVGCKYHLAIEVNERNGSIRFTWPGLEPDEWPETCVLGVARKHPDGLTLEDVASLVGVGFDRMRQIEDEIMDKLREKA
jgi:hypothetical protein